MKPTLILGCSKTKRPDGGVAIDVYDGPLFRVIRKNLDLDSISLLILSAKYGLIWHKQIIQSYDYILSSTHHTNSIWIYANVREPFQNLVEAGLVELSSDIFACCGRNYFLCLKYGLPPWAETNLQRIPPHDAPIGKMAEALKQWRRERSPQVEQLSLL